MPHNATHVPGVTSAGNTTQHIPKQRHNPKLGDLTTTEAGKAQIEVEEKFILPRGVVHPFNRMCVCC